MNLNLPSEVNDFVKALVAQGRFSSEEDAIVEGIKLLMGRERLRGEIQKGVAQLDAGEFYDEETVFAEINAEVDKIEEERHGSLKHAETSVFRGIERRPKADRSIHRPRQTNCRPSVDCKVEGKMSTHS